MDYFLSEDSELAQAFFRAITRITDRLDGITKRHKPSFLNERYITEKELSSKLKISKRALLDYRNQGLIPYYQINDKNILYKESDIEKVLQRGYRKISDD